MPTLAVVVTARPSWAKLLPVCEALRASGFELDVIACAYALTHVRSGVVDVMAADGWAPTTRLHAAIDANTLESSVLTTGLLTVRIGGHFAESQPDGIVICADRHETLGAAIAGAYLNIPVCHLQGGEVSGSIDNKVRNANTALADWHCVAHEDAAARVRARGIAAARVVVTGCPSIDVARVALDAPLMTRHELDKHGVGGSVDPQRPFALVMMHSVTTHPETAEHDLHEAMRVAEGKALPIVAFWPGADAGMDDAAHLLRSHTWAAPVRMLRSLPPTRFLRLLSQAAIGIGNSSALVREGSFYGIPRIILGDRQQGRDVTQEPSSLYGDGFAAPRIAEVCEQMVNA